MILKFFLCVASLCADGNDFSSSRDKNSLLAKLSWEERKNACSGCKSLFCLQKSSSNKEVLFQDDEKLSAVAQRQARNKEKISGCFHFCGGCSNNI
jgi:hypothetical protein